MPKIGGWRWYEMVVECSSTLHIPPAIKKGDVNQVPILQVEPPKKVEQLGSVKAILFTKGGPRGACHHKIHWIGLTGNKKQTPPNT